MLGIMSGRIINKIPMTVFHLRNFKGHDENITLLQACYDNPLFEEDSRFKPESSVNGIHKKAGGSNDYRIAADEEPDIRFQKEAERRRKLCIIAAIVAILAIVAVVIGLVLNYTKGKSIYSFSSF